MENFLKFRILHFSRDTGCACMGIGVHSLVDFRLISTRTNCH
jgi:hypothetical protein